MPLDGNALRTEARLYRGKQATARRAADILGLVRRRFVTYEWRWIQREISDDENGFCLLGGLIEAGQERLVYIDGALSYVFRAITNAQLGRRPTDGIQTAIMNYNDFNSFVDVMEILAEAKVLAEADVDNEP